jgi:hypothetical protein
MLSAGSYVDTNIVLGLLNIARLVIISNSITNLLSFAFVKLSVTSFIGNSASFDLSDFEFVCFKYTFATLTTYNCAKFLISEIFGKGDNKKGKSL